MIWSTIQVIVMLLVVIYLINFTIKYLAKHTNQNNLGMQVLQKMPVTKTSSLAIVKILDQYYLMSLAEQQNQILRELNAEEQAQLVEELEQRKQFALQKSQQIGADFKKILHQKIGKGK